MKYQQKKTTYFTIAILAFSVLLCVPSCGRRHRCHTGESNRNTTTEIRQNEHNSRRHSGGGGCSRRNGSGATYNYYNNNTFSINDYHPVYFTQNIEVSQDVSFQEALYVMDPSTREIEQKYGVGGTKLIAEMSADVGGIYYSRNSNTEVNINILSLDQLKLHIDYNKTSVYQQIINQCVVLNNSSVGILRNESSIAGIIVDFIDALQSGKIVVRMSFANITNRSVVCEIQQGQMLEIVNENVQNLVVAETYKFAIAANQQTEISIHAYCASHHRGDPSGSRVRFTPYILNASSSVYESQTSVWNYIENRY